MRIGCVGTRRTCRASSPSENLIRCLFRRAKFLPSREKRRTCALPRLSGSLASLYLALPVFGQTPGQQNPAYPAVPLPAVQPLPPASNAGFPSPDEYIAAARSLQMLHLYDMEDVSVRSHRASVISIRRRNS